jgi:hypothetical protein
LELKDLLLRVEETGLPFSLSFEKGEEILSRELLGNLGKV